MFFLLSKIIYWLIMPVSLIVFCMLGSLFVRSDKLKVRLRYVGIALLVIFTNPFLAKHIMNTWEDEAIPYSSLTQKYDYGIVLAGITEPNRPPYDRAHFNKGADRLTNAIDLYNKKNIKKILISGGSGVITFEGKTESVMLQQFAISAGVKPRDILIEKSSRNTYENAFNCKKILTAENIQSEVLLITSAFHMYRAKGCFDKLHVSSKAFPTDYYGGPIHYTIDELVIPKLYALRIWSILIKEWIGIVAYKMAGYI